LEVSIRSMSLVDSVIPPGAALENGNNDRLLLRAVKESGGLAIAVDNGEGCAVDSIQSANVFILGASNARDIPLKMHRLKGPGGDHDVQKRLFLNGFDARVVLLKKDRLKATLRF